MPHDWREPFLEFQDQLRPLDAACLNIGHCVVLSVNRTESDIQSMIHWLEPACQGKNLSLTIPVRTVGCQYHNHLFFSTSQHAVHQFGRLLADIERWMDGVPGGIIPAFDVPKCQSQIHQNLIQWVSLVYYLAWSSDVPYLFAELEYLDSLEAIAFSEWAECPQPPGCQPLDWLIHRSTAAGEIPKWKRKFEDRQTRMPDLIDAYLTGDLVAASMAAIDLLVYVLPGKRRRRSPLTDAYLERLATKTPGQKKTKRDLEDLKLRLLDYHNPWTNSGEDKDGKDTDLEKPLYADQIAVMLSWAPPGNGRKGQSKVSRMMKILFGPGGMKSYGNELRRAIRNHGQRKAIGLSLLHDVLVEGKLWGKRGRPTDDKGKSDES